MEYRSAPWLEPAPPWDAPVPSALCAPLGIDPAGVALVEVLSAPCTAVEVIAVRGGRFVPLFGHGLRRDEAVRALANVSRALGAQADPRGAEHALAMALHPALGARPLAALARGARDGSADPSWALAALALPGVLGGPDALREQIAREFSGVPDLALEAALLASAGGGDYGAFREHYGALSAGPHNDAPAVRAVRAWFDFVLARRFAGLDALHALWDGGALDPASRWLVASAQWVAGEERARSRLAESAEAIVGAVRPLLPRLLGVVAREMAELVRRPLALRMQHLRCVAARDHAAMSIRAWLTAATEPEHDEALGDANVGALGPEPTRAGRAAIEGRSAAGDFLLDWFVPDREARDAVDGYARQALRIYHRLRGAQLYARAEQALRPAGGMLTNMERVVWAAPGARAGE